MKAEATMGVEELSNRLEKLRKEGAYNVLVPTVTIQEISPMHKPVLEIVQINTEPKGGEIYEIVKGSGDWSLNSTALSKISFAAGLLWNARNCRRTDNGSNPKITSYQAEAFVRKEDGTYMPVNREYQLDLEVIEEEIRTSWETKSQDLAKKEKWTEEKRKDFVEKYVKRDMLQKRKFRLQLAQTGAMARVIKFIFGLKGTYKIEELKKPFIVPKIVFAPDVNDPQVKAMLMKQGLDATALLFGPQDQGLTQKWEQLEHHTGEDVSEDVIDTEGKEVVAQDITTTVDAGVKKEEPVTIIPFEKMDEKGRIDFINQLIKKKGYDSAKMKRPLETFTKEEKEKFKAHLESMADVEELPFS